MFLGIRAFAASSFVYLNPVMRKNSNIENVATLPLRSKWRTTSSIGLSSRHSNALKNCPDNCMSSNEYRDHKKDRHNIFVCSSSSKSSTE